MSSDYRLAPGFAARLLGLLVVGLGLVVLVLVLLVALTDLPSAVLPLVYGAGSALLLAALLVTRRLPVVRLDDDGYRVRLLRGAGVRSAAWRDVAEAATTTAHGVRCVVLELVDGRTTTLPVGALHGDPEEFVRELQGYLRRGQRSRPLGGDLAGGA